MKKILFFLFSYAIFAGHLYAQSESTRVTIVATLFATYDFVKQVGKDKVDVALILPAGVEPHNFEPKPFDIIKISNADLFIYTGKYMEPWAQDLISGIKNKKLMIVDASLGIPLMLLEEKQNSHAEQDLHEHEGKDPHIWLDLNNAQKMVNTIANVLAAKDPQSKDFYLSNAKEYNLKLAALDEKFRSVFSSCKLDTIIYGGHFAFGYFAKSYGLKHISPYVGFSPNAEPSAKAMVELIKKVKSLGSNVIYYEELIDPKVAKVIANEAKVKIELLHGAHNVSKDELSQGVTFIDIMEKNLEKLRLGLNCS